LIKKALTIFWSSFIFSLVIQILNFYFKDAKVYDRIRELREAGLWESTRLPKCMDPPRRKTHWDFFMEEALWLATDFLNERKFKRRLASKVNFLCYFF
jgi:hypothetical protein